MEDITEGLADLDFCWIEPPMMILLKYSDVFREDEIINFINTHIYEKIVAIRIFYQDKHTLVLCSIPEDVGKRVVSSFAYRKISPEIFYIPTESSWKEIIDRMDRVEQQRDFDNKPDNSLILEQIRSREEFYIRRLKEIEELPFNTSRISDVLIGMMIKEMREFSSLLRHD